MADRAVVRKLCKSLFSSRFTPLNAKSIRYFTRYLSSRASSLRGEEESRISVITDGCSVEELENVQDLVDGNLEVRDDFISKEEESLLLKEVEPYLKRQKYQYDHWDDAIHGYRETEKSRWSKECLSIFQRIRDVAFKSDLELLPHVHALDLAKTGYIKPHIDSIKFCGAVISGLSLLSPSVMRFKHEKLGNVKVDALLRPRSLYIIKDAVRYQFTHEILSEDESVWKGETIPRDRRISLDNSKSEGFPLFPPFSLLSDLWRLPPFSGLRCPDERVDRDLDNDVKMGTHSLDEILTPKDKGQMSQHVPHFSSSSSFSSVTIVDSNGVTEKRTTRRDSNGNEEVTITQRISDQTRTVTRRKDNQGNEETQVDSVNKGTDDSELFRQPTPLSSIYESVLEQFFPKRR